MALQPDLMWYKARSILRRTSKEEASIVASTEAKDNDIQVEPKLPTSIVTTITRILQVEQRYSYSFILIFEIPLTLLGEKSLRNL